jgi:type IV pilus assembly protein PilW
VNPLSSTIRVPRNAGGFTLVEIMVAMIIGMLGIIIMMQMFSIFEAQKRTTTSGDDAQNAGAIALYGIQQNIQQAGYCFSVTQPSLGAVGLLNPVMIDVAPLANVNVRDTNTNTLLVAYGNDSCVFLSSSDAAAAPASAPAPATLTVLAYAVKNGNLMQCDYLMNDCATPAVWTQIAGEVVSLKAECVGNQSIRIALVTRNPQLEKAEVTGASGTTAAPSWSGANAIDLTATTADDGFTWKNYRYKTFETLAPIRNTIWTGGIGC